MNKIIADRRYWLIPLAIWTAMALSSLVWNLAGIRHQLQEISAGQGREVFRIMEAMRLWNARHGGVYVLQDAGTPPNPYLEDVEKETQTIDGRRLTRVNPAYMTRQVAATFYELTSIRVHITSLKPINPDNAADPWEAAALKAFERGEMERAEVVDEAGGARARYIAPLVTREACLDCHARLGYKVGEVRGGISVSFPTAPIAASLASQVRNAVLVHLVAWALVAALTLFALSRSRRQVLALARGRDELESLVAQRTAELQREVGERRQAETRLRLLVEASGNGIFGLTGGGECTFINPVALKLLGADDADTFLGRPLLELIAPDDSQRQRLLDALRLGQSLFSDEIAFERADGSTFQAEVRLDPIDDGPAGAVVNFSDVTERKAAEASIWRQANYDALTGLPNRSLFYDRLAQSLAQARRSREILAVLFVDLDGFKSVNDIHGHDAGDWLLQQCAQRLQDGLRDSDMAARLAGDEFVVIVRHLGSEERAGIVAAKLIAALAEPYRFGDQELRVTASIGIGVYPDDADNAADLVSAADQAMYKAKEAGKETYRYYGGRYDSSRRPAT